MARCVYFSNLFRSSLNFWATVCKTVRRMLSDRCLSVCLSILSVTFVHCGQTVGRINVKLGMQVGLGPGPHCVRYRDPAPPPQKGVGAPQIFGLCLLSPNGWMDQDNTWHGGRPQPRRPCGVRWGPSGDPAPHSSPSPLSAHAYCGQTVAHLSNC